MSKASIHTERTIQKLHPVKDGYLCGTTTFFGMPYEIEAFRVEPGGFNDPNNARPKRMQEVLEGLLIHDLPLNQVEIPGHPGKWLVFYYPGVDEQYHHPEDDE